MTKRADRRRYAILGVLAEEGPCGVSVLERRLRREPGTLYPDLAVLEHFGRIKVLLPDREPGHTAYRLATTAERWDPERH